MESKYVTECFQGLDTRQLSFGLELLHLLPGLDLPAHVQQYVVHQLGPQLYHSMPNRLIDDIMYVN